MATSGTGGRACCKRKYNAKCHWTPEEDELLTALVQIHGPVKWDTIATYIHGRSGKSCRIRWLNQLNPQIDKTPFSPEEKQRLVLLQREYGNRWSIIVNHFPGRTDNQVKNQYHILAKTRHNKAAASSPNNDSHLQNGSVDLSPNISMDPVGLQSSGITNRENNSHGFAPEFPMMPGSVGTGPSFVAGSSSVYGKDESPIQVGAPSSMLSSLDPRPQEKPIYGSSMISDANSASIQFQDHEFIDFMGIGSS